MSYDGFYGELSTRGTINDLLSQANNIRISIKASEVEVAADTSDVGLKHAEVTLKAAQVQTDANLVSTKAQEVKANSEYVAGIVSNGSLARGAVAVDSIADLIALPAGQRKEGLRYLVKGYHAGSDVGGGEFYWDSARVTESDGGLVLSGFVRRDDGPLTPEMFGAFGDGESDDKQAMDQMFSVSEGRHVVISRHHRTSVIYEWEGGFALKSNSTVTFVGDGKISLLPHYSRRYEILGVKGIDNVTIIRPRLDGRKDLNTHTEGEWGHGIGIFGSNNVTVVGPKMVNMWGDGINIGSSLGGADFCTNVRIERPISENCRRQGISVESVKTLRIVSPKASNISGTLPSAGIDIEPNSNTDFLEDIIITDPETENCSGPGILVFLQNLVGAVPKHIGITVRGHKDTGSRSGATLQSLIVPAGSGAVTGDILFDQPKYILSEFSGITITSWQHTALRTRVVRPVIIDWNTSRYAEADYGSAISIINDTGSQLDPSAYIGNIEITDRVYVDNVGLGRGNDYVVNKVSDLVRDVRLIEFGADAPLKLAQYSNSGVTLTDERKLYRQPLNANSVLTINNIPTILNSVGYPANPVYTLPSGVSPDFNKSLTFINSWPGNPSVDYGQTGKMTIKPPAGGHFLGYAVDAGISCSFYEGNEISVSHVRGAIWRVDRLVGDWEGSIATASAPALP